MRLVLWGNVIGCLAWRIYSMSSLYLWVIFYSWSKKCEIRSFFKNRYHSAAVERNHQDHSVALQEAPVSLEVWEKGISDNNTLKLCTIVNVYAKYSLCPVEWCQWFRIQGLINTNICGVPSFYHSSPWITISLTTCSDECVKHSAIAQKPTVITVSNSHSNHYTSPSCSCWPQPTPLTIKDHSAWLCNFSHTLNKQLIASHCEEKQVERNIMCV